MYCSACGQANTEGASRCRCGNSLVSRAAQPAEAAPPSGRAAALSPHRYPLWIWLMALGVVWAIALSLKQLPPYYRAATLIKQADTLVKQGRDKDAVEFYAQVLDLVPTSKRARMGMAMAYFKSPQEEDRKKGMAAIKGLSFEDDEWKKLAAVMPPEYQRLYKVEKK